jgi:hypothetical protein
VVGTRLTRRDSRRDGRRGRSTPLDAEIALYYTKGGAAAAAGAIVQTAGAESSLVCPQDPRPAAWRVLGSFILPPDVASDPDRVPAATAALNASILRGPEATREFRP